jgi:hypothetical protein
VLWFCAACHLALFLTNNQSGHDRAFLRLCSSGTTALSCGSVPSEQ